MSTESVATFGAGCFWGVEHNFMNLDGVVKTSVGYMGGKFKNPTYFDVCSGITGHAEVVNVVYDSEKIHFNQLCSFFFKINLFHRLRVIRFLHLQKHLFQFFCLGIFLLLLHINHLKSFHKI